jgi:hypothetical protein
MTRGPSFDFVNILCEQRMSQIRAQIDWPKADHRMFSAAGPRTDERLPCC